MSCVPYFPYLCTGRYYNKRRISLSSFPVVVTSRGKVSFANRVLFLERHCFPPLSLSFFHATSTGVVETEQERERTRSAAGGGELNHRGGLRSERKVLRLSVVVKGSLCTFDC